MCREKNDGGRCWRKKCALIPKYLRIPPRLSHKFFNGACRQHSRPGQCCQIAVHSAILLKSSEINHKSSEKYSDILYLYNWDIKNI
jgi:hypothetical protein